jgi:hypothetical protein
MKYVIRMGKYTFTYQKSFFADSNWTLLWMSCLSPRLDIVSSPNPMDRVGTIRTWRFYDLFVAQFVVSAAITRNIPQLADSRILTSLHVCDP